MLLRVLRHRSPVSEFFFKFLQLTFGVSLFGIALALMVRSELGLGPWDVLHVGIHKVTGISIGVASAVAGLAVMLGALFFRVRPGFGTIANIVLIGIFIDLCLPLVPPAGSLFVSLSYYIIALAICGLGTGIYISAGLGAGPRDSLMLALSYRYNLSVRMIRTFIELFALVSGYFMGGTVGIGTILFALLIGPASQLGLSLFGVDNKQEPAAVLLGEEEEEIQLRRAA